jgi:rhamnose transport system permease protein
MSQKIKSLLSANFILKSKELIRTRESGIFLVLILVSVATTLINPRFISGYGLSDLLLNTAMIGCLAVGLTPVVIARHIDLSIASATGFSAFVTAHIIVGQGWGVIPAFFVGACVGAVIGAVNGVLIAGLRLPSLVVTLGTLYIIRGIDYQFANNKQFTAEKLPTELVDLAQDKIFGVPILFCLVLLLALFGVWWMKFTRFGRDLYAIGSNPPAAEIVGIKVFSRTLFAFVWCGTLAGIAGVMYLSIYAIVDSSAFLNQELIVVTAVVIGGINIFGGVGTIVGALLGAVLLRVLIGALVALGVAQFWQQAINGLLLLIAIGIDRFLSRRSETKIERIRAEKKVQTP